MEVVKVALAAMMRRWQNGISAEVRAEIMIETSDAALMMRHDQ
jgi:hypothetical protein